MMEMDNDIPNANNNARNPEDMDSNNEESPPHSGSCEQSVSKEGGSGTKDETEHKQQKIRKRLQDTCLLGKFIRKDFRVGSDRKAERDRRALEIADTFLLARDYEGVNLAKAIKLRLLDDINNNSWQSPLINATQDVVAKVLNIPMTQYILDDMKAFRHQVFEEDMSTIQFTINFETGHLTNSVHPWGEETEYESEDYEQIQAAGDVGKKLQSKGVLSEKHRLRAFQYLILLCEEGNLLGGFESFFSYSAVIWNFQHCLEDELNARTFRLFLFSKGREGLLIFWNLAKDLHEMEDGPGKTNLIGRLQQTFLSDGGKRLGITGGFFQSLKKYQNLPEAVLRTAVAIVREELERKWMKEYVKDWPSRKRILNSARVFVGDNEVFGKCDVGEEVFDKSTVGEKGVFDKSGVSEEEVFEKSTVGESRRAESPNEPEYQRREEESVTRVGRSPSALFRVRVSRRVLERVVSFAFLGKAFSYTFGIIRSNGFKKMVQKHMKTGQPCVNNLELHMKAILIINHFLHSKNPPTVQVISLFCDADLVFINCVAKWPGSVHNARVMVALWLLKTVIIMFYLQLYK
nr:hypothetical protein BaRGS_003797 [Batillaria attramentaria]